MTHIDFFLLSIIIGIIGVSIIDIIGSISSRKWNFSYTYFALLSFAVYILIGFLAGNSTNILLALAATCLVGVYDATIGWHFSIKFKAYWGKYEEEALGINLSSRIKNMLTISILFGLIGYFLSTQFPLM